MNPKPVDREVVDAFCARLEALCVEFGVILLHEDGHGSAYLVRPTPDDFVYGEPGNGVAISYRKDR